MGMYPFRLAASRQATFPKGTAFGGGGKVSGIAQRRPLGGAGCERSEQTEGVPAARLFPQETSAAATASRCVPSREKAILENPQIFQNCEIINILSAEYAQSNAEGISNRPAVGRKDFSFCIEMCF